jgi:hypothetical protein
MDVRGYPTYFRKALAIGIVAALCSGMAVPASAMPNMPHLFADEVAAAAILLMPASITCTEIALAAIPVMPRAATATDRALPCIANCAHNSKHGVSRL